MRAGSPAVEGSSGALDARRRPSVAVLPFADMSAARDQEYVCDGLAEEIITELARLEGLRVSARTSSFAFKGKLEDVREIGRRLGVAAVLEGSLRRAGNRLRIAAQLIDVADGYHIWSERFDRDADDILEIEDEIARGVVEKLKVKLLAAESGAPARRHQPSRQAHDLYLQGRFLFGRRGPADAQRALACFEQAIAADPDYAKPHMGIAAIFVFLGLWGFLPPRPAYGRAREAALAALERDETLEEAHLVLAAALVFGEWNWAGARPHFERAGRSAPSVGMGLFALAVFHLAEGRPSEALRLVDANVEDEPSSAVAYGLAAALHVGIREVAEAAPLAEKAMELDGASLLARYWLGICRGAQGRLEEATELLDEVVTKGLAVGLAYLPAILFRAGLETEARERAEGLEKVALERYVSPFTRALAWAGVGGKGRALDLLAEAEAVREPFFMMALVGPGYLALHPAWTREWFAERRRQLLPRAYPRCTP
jgi:TolB-like protein/Tfp pilus assembly protein PilF